ncbi:hypothetical protein OG535_20290 [Kitasatospora sp. NBC_00085]|uniref:hypothetical protein n=1 Tax=unclassified Kitasatospora TaxID=2633591 RepID=UPI00324F3A62
MSEHSESYEVTAHPTLDADGVTIWQKYGGRAPEGYFYDGWHKVVPGDPRYDELLAQARRNPQQNAYDEDDDEEEATVHPETLAILQEMQRKTRERNSGHAPGGRHRKPS